MVDNKTNSRADSSSSSDDFCEDSGILSWRCQPAVERFPGRLRFYPMKAFLNVWRKLSEIYLGNSCFRSEFNPIRFNAGYCRVFVHLSVHSLEVVGKGECSQQKRQDCGCSSPFVHARRILPSLLSTRQ